MRLEDLDYDALINQMWGSEANLQSFLVAEVPRLCSKICGPDKPVPTVKVTHPVNDRENAELSRRYAEIPTNAVIGGRLGS